MKQMKRDCRTTITFVPVPLLKEKSNMAKYCVKKGIQLIIVTILISFFSFAVIYAAPGDISGMYLNEQMSDEEKEAIRENLGLNKSMPEQYWGWAKEVLKGDFGISLANHTSVSEQILKRLPATLQLMGAALFFRFFLRSRLDSGPDIAKTHGSTTSSADFPISECRSRPSGSGWC